MITEKEKENFLHILKELNNYNSNLGKLFTQKELSIHLKTSRKKIVDFQKGRIFDFWLLCRYADILGKGIKFNLDR